MPGQHHATLSYFRVVRLVKLAPSMAAVMARPGSLERAAIEAEFKAKRPPQPQLGTNFGCGIPFSTLRRDADHGLDVGVFVRNPCSCCQGETL